jgi:HTH-type transcriptional regulator/antitoxin HigA
MDIKPIRTQADYEMALKEVDALFNARPNTPESDRLDVLVILIEAYAAEHFPIPIPDDPIEVLKYYMESRGISRSALAPLLGGKERVSDVLNGKRGLSLEMIRRLHDQLGIPAELLIKPVRKMAQKKTVSKKAAQPEGWAALV